MSNNHNHNYNEEMRNIRIFGLGNSGVFAGKIAKYLGIELHSHHEEWRPDGESYATSLTNVRGCDVFLVSSLYGDDQENVNEKFMKTAIFINTLRHSSAHRITLVAPYLCYMRQDRKTESRAPIATQAIAMMLEAVGIDRVLTMDVHNLGAEQNAFRVPIDNLEARKLLADFIVSEIVANNNNKNFREFIVLSPDAGGAVRTKQMQYSLSKRLGENVGIAYADKTRINADSIEKVRIIGDITCRNVIVVEDIISTGGTIQEIDKAISRQGGIMWGVATTHGLMVGGAAKNLQDISKIFLADTVNPFLYISGVRTVSVAPLFAEAIRRIHLEGGSISELLDD